MRLPKATLSIAALAVANLMPLAGVLLFSWDVRSVVLLYWVENLVVGFYALLKMALAPVRNPAEHLGKLFAIPFFCVHFGGFCAGHGAFLLIFFKLGDRLFDPAFRWPGPLIFIGLLLSVITQLWRSRPPGMEWPVIGLFISHGVSFVQNYLLGGERKVLTVERAMGQPYGRIVVMHITIIAGGFGVMALGSPVPLLVILIGLKIAVDIALHKRSHARIGRRESDGARASVGSR